MKKRYIFLIIILLLAAGLVYLGRQTADPERHIAWGVTFDKTFMSAFNLDWRAAYLATLDDLGVKNLRLAARWTDIEPEDNKYDFADLDWQIKEAARRGAKIILTVGRKLPRWPECHIPEWAAGDKEALLEYVEITIERYKNEPAIAAWQVENEPFLPFGICPKADANLLDAEIALVKELDQRPVIVTDSGELSLWVPAARRADIFGTTLYRWVWNEWVGSYQYPIPPGFFRLKERLARLFVGQEKPFIVIELQSEPWTHKQIYEISVDEQLALMPLKELNATLDYAKQAGFNEYYLWGVEWWYYLSKNGRGEYWERVKELIPN